MTVLPRASDPLDKYVRVYYRVRTDERFTKVYDDDRALATWLRMLLDADAVWPAPASLPRRARASCVKLLVDAGLVELLPGDHFRIHGLDRERERRAGAAKAAGLASGRSRSVERPLNGRSTGVEQALNGNRTTDERRPNLDEDEHSQAEDEHGAQPIVTVVDHLEKLTGRLYSFGAGSKVHETLTADVRDFPVIEVCGAIDAVAGGTKHPDIGQLVFGASRLLHPITTPPKPAPPPKPLDTSEIRRLAAERARFSATQTQEEIDAEVAAYKAGRTA